MTGVSYHKPSGRWQARISLGDLRKTIGYYKTEEEAQNAVMQYNTMSLSRLEDNLIDVIASIHSKLNRIMAQEHYKNHTHGE